MVLLYMDGSLLKIGDWCINLTLALGRNNGVDCSPFEWNLTLFTLSSLGFPWLHFSLYIQMFLCFLGFMLLIFMFEALNLRDTTVLHYPQMYILYP